MPAHEPPEGRASHSHQWPHLLENSPRCHLMNSVALPRAGSSSLAGSQLRAGKRVATPQTRRPVLAVAKTYTVKPGDSVYAIAVKYKVCGRLCAVPRNSISVIARRAPHERRGCFHRMVLSGSTELEQHLCWGGYATPATSRKRSTPALQVNSNATPPPSRVWVLALSEQLLPHRHRR